MSLNHIITESKVFDRIRSTFKNTEVNLSIQRDGREIYPFSYALIHYTGTNIDLPWLFAATPVKIPIAPPPVITPSPGSVFFIATDITNPAGTLDLKVSRGGTYEIQAEISFYFSVTAADMEVHLFANEIDLGAKVSLTNTVGTKKQARITTMAVLVADDVLSIRILFNNAANNINYDAITFHVKQVS